MRYDYDECMEEIIIECKGLTRFHVPRENDKLAKNIIKMCRDFGLEVEVIE